MRQRGDGPASVSKRGASPDRRRCASAITLIATSRSRREIARAIDLAHAARRRAGRRFHIGQDESPVERHRVPWESTSFYRAVKARWTLDFSLTNRLTDRYASMPPATVSTSLTPARESRLAASVDR